MQDKARELIRQPAVIMLAAGTALLIFSGILWYTKVYLAPRTVFEDMLTRNLTTNAVVIRQVSRELNGVKIDKRSDLTFGNQALVRIKATTTAIDSGTSVVTETIAGKDQEYNRYTNITLGADSPVVDTEPLVNKWAEGTGTATAYPLTLLRQYGLPMGPLPAADRAKLQAYQDANDVFQTDYKVERGSREGRKTYTYQVNIRPEQYVAYLKTYAEALQLRELDEVDPSVARQTPPVPVRLTVDVASRRLVAADYPGLGYEESFTDYNVLRDIPTPKAQISAEELQALVAQLR